MTTHHMHDSAPKHYFRRRSDGYFVALAIGVGVFAALFVVMIWRA